MLSAGRKAVPRSSLFDAGVQHKKSLSLFDYITIFKTELQLPRRPICAGMVCAIDRPERCRLLGLSRSSRRVERRLR